MFGVSTEGWVLGGLASGKSVDQVNLYPFLGSEYNLPENRADRHFAPDVRDDQHYAPWVREHMARLLEKRHQLPQPEVRAILRWRPAGAGWRGPARYGWGGLRERRLPRRTG